MEAPRICASHLYWFQLDSQGNVGKLTSIGAALSGEVNALAASADGQTIAYTLAGCERGDKGFLRVISVTSKRLQQWTSVDLTGGGRIGIASNLSLSADGKLLTFVGWSPRHDTASVEELATGAPGGGRLTGRAKAVLRVAANQDGSEPKDAIAVSPDGASFYLCSVTARPGAQVTSIGSYATATGQLLKPVVRLSGKNPASGQPLPGCAMSVSAGDEFALVPYAVSYPATGSHTARLSVARINLATGSSAVLTFPVSLDLNLAGPPAAAVSIAW